MQDLDHNFVADTATGPHAARTEAALKSIAAERRAKVRQGYIVLNAFAGLNPKSSIVGLARLFVVGALGLWANYLLYMQIWGS